MEIYLFRHSIRDMDCKSKKSKLKNKYCNKWKITPKTKLTKKGKTQIKSIGNYFKNLYENKDVFYSNSLDERCIESKNFFFKTWDKSKIKELKYNHHKTDLNFKIQKLLFKPYKDDKIKIDVNNSCKFRLKLNELNIKGRIYQSYLFEGLIDTDKDYKHYLDENEKKNLMFENKKDSILMWVNFFKNVLKTNINFNQNKSALNINYSKEGFKIIQDLGSIHKVLKYKIKKNENIYEYINKNIYKLNILKKYQPYFETILINMYSVIHRIKYRGCYKKTEIDITKSIYNLNRFLYFLLKEKTTKNKVFFFFCHDGTIIRFLNSIGYYNYYQPNFCDYIKIKKKTNTQVSILYNHQILKNKTNETEEQIINNYNITEFNKNINNKILLDFNNIQKNIINVNIKLKKISIYLFRHGVRHIACEKVKDANILLKNSCKTQDIKNNKQLTSIGKELLYLVGELFKKQFTKDNKIYTLNSSDDRCKNSSIHFLKGYYNNKKLSQKKIEQHSLNINFIKDMSMNNILKYYNKNSSLTFEKIDKCKLIFKKIDNSYILYINSKNNVLHKNLFNSKNIKLATWQQLIDYLCLFLNIPNEKITINKKINENIYKILIYIDNLATIYKTIEFEKNKSLYKLFITFVNPKINLNKKDKLNFINYFEEMVLNVHNIFNYIKYKDCDPKTTHILAGKNNNTHNIYYLIYFLQYILKQQPKQDTNLIIFGHSGTLFYLFNYFLKIDNYYKPEMNDYIKIERDENGNINYYYNNNLLKNISKKTNINSYETKINKTMVNLMEQNIDKKYKIFEDFDI